jgi:predicted alpha/beta superfamily hydrolase
LHFWFLAENAKKQTERLLNSQPELVVHERFHIPQLGRERTIRVLLPGEYWQKQARRYPVVYMQDGQNLFDAQTSAFGHWHLREAMAKQPNKRQSILVGIDNGGLERINEYAPFARQHVGGGGGAYCRFLVETLKPFIDGQYRSLPDREHTAIVGSSMGGLIAYYAALRYATVFGMAGVLSPSLWFNPQIMDMARSIQGPRARIYMCASRTEMPGMSEQMERAYGSLMAAGYSEAEVRLVLRARGRHSEKFWGREFKPMYDWLFRK